MEQDTLTASKTPVKGEDLTGLWLVCFTGKEENWWWDRIKLTRPCFRHCYLLQYQVPVDRWVMLDWRTGICDVIVIHHHEISYLLGQMRATHGTAVLYRGRQPERDILYRAGYPLMYCVQAVLQVMALPTRWTFTPWQLYKRLMASGGYELVNYRTQ